jgi:hypothetical protein
MTREQIIQMAREAGWPNWDGNVPTDDHEFRDFTEPLERFAALVAAAEREACAQIVDANAKQCGTAIRLILESNAAAIRARGQA